MNSAGKEILQVDLGARSYPIHIGRDLEAELLEMKEDLLDRGRKVVAVFDQGLMDANPRFCEKFRADVHRFSGHPPGRKRNPSSAWPSCGTSCPQARSTDPVPLLPSAEA